MVSFTSAVFPAEKFGAALSRKICRGTLYSVGQANFQFFDTIVQIEIGMKDLC